MLPEGPSTLEIVRRCMRRLEERQSVFAEHEIEALALAHSPGRHSIGEVRDAVAGIVRDGHLVEAELRRADRAFVTDRALKAERSTIAAMKAGIGAGEALAREKDVVARLDGAGLTEGQEEAVRTILLAPDRMVGVQGRAGTGKTTMLRHVRALAGKRPVIGLAPSAAAARVEDNDTAKVTGLMLTPGDGELAVAWAPVPNATGYEVQWKSGGQGYNTSGRQATVGSGSTASHTISSLTNGTTYTVRVEDNDTAKVTGVMLTPGDGELAVAWAPVPNATGYEVQWKSGGQGYNTSGRQATIGSGSTASHTISSLTNGTTYTVRVRDAALDIARAAVRAVRPIRPALRREPCLGRLVSRKHPEEPVQRQTLAI